MALENVLIAKIGGGLVAVAGASGAIYACKDAIIDSLFGSDETYLVVKSSSSESVPSDLSELYVSSSDKKTETKNFKCKFTNTSNKEEFDDTCDIFSIKEKDNANKLTNLNGIKDGLTKTVKTDISTNKFFKLKVKKNSFSFNKFDGTEKISLASTENEKTAKKYGDFSVLYKVEGNTVISGKTNLIIGKSKNKTDLTESGTHCSLKGLKEDSKQECAIYKFDNQTGKQKHTDLVFDSSNPVTAAVTNNFVNDKLYLIDLKTKKLDVSFWNSKTVIVHDTDATSSKKIIEFEFVAALATDENSFTASSTKTFFLS